MPSTITVTTSTTISSPVTYDGGTDASFTAYTLQGAASLSFTDSSTIQITSSQDGAALFGMLDSPGIGHTDTFTVGSSGVFSVSATGADARAQGLWGLANVPMAITNNGAFTVSAAHATGAELDGGGSFTNSVTGHFAVTSLDDAAGGVSFGAGQATIRNDGTISLTGTGANVFYLNHVTSGSFTNSGTIQFSGAVNPLALWIQNLNDASIYSVTNSGSMEGGILVSGSSTRIAVTNTGQISGDVNLGNGNDTLDSHLGTITGLVTLGSGSSTATLGAENNTVALAAGTHAVDAGGGSNAVTYAGAAAGVHVSLALQGQAQSTGVGSDTLSNFQGLTGSALADTLEGGGSAATSLTGGAGADTFVYRAGEGSVTVTDFSHAEGDRIDLSHLGSFHGLADVLAASSQVGSDTVIALAGGGGVTLDGVALAGLAASDFILTGPSVGPGIGGSPQTGSGVINGGAGDDWLQGGAGDDTLHGAGGSNYLDGGDGLNTALYDGVYRQYTVTTGAQTLVSNGSGGADDLVDIQRIQFTDGYLAISPNDTAGEVYRLYEATLARAPDQDGLTDWVNQLNGGVSLQTVAAGFVGSQEFQTTYGALDNAHFVTLLYNNVLHRTPDDAGLAYWVAELASGQDTRAQVVLGFSQSQEDIGDLAAPVEQGLWIADPVAGQVARLYDTVFGRLPDSGGLADWTHLMKSGTSLQTVANGFVGSQEFQTAYGALDSTHFVTLLYNNVLHREPDAAGLGDWLTALSGGESRAQVVVGFSESAEHIANTAGHIDGGIWVTG